MRRGNEYAQDIEASLISAEGGGVGVGYTKPNVVDVQDKVVLTGRVLNWSVL
jgi:hypothetical protein